MNTPFSQSSFTVSALLVLLVSGCARLDHLPMETERRYDRFLALETANELPQLVPETKMSGAIPVPAKPLDLTVEQAITLAMAKNRDLHIQQVNPELARTLEAVERGDYDPELFGELEFLREKRSESADNDTRSVVEESGRTSSLGLRQKLPTGTLIEASLGLEKSDVSADGQEQSSRVGLSITQSLLRGFGPTVNLVSLRQAQLDTAISESELRGITESILAETENTYWDYVLAEQKIHIFERSLVLARHQLDDIRQRIEVGTLPRIEASAALAEVARRQQALIDARSFFEEIRLRLVRLINPEGQRPFDLQINATSLTSLAPTPIVDLEERLQLAAQSRPDLNEARLRLKQNRLEIITTRNGLLPRLDLFINLGKTGYAESFSGSWKDLDSNNHDISAGIQFSQYLFNRQAQAYDTAARISRLQAVESVENLKQLVELDVRLAVNEFERSRKQIAATRETRLRQEETLNAETERFNVGSSTALLVAQAQRDLLLSTVDEAEALINCRKALIALYRAEGSLLERRGVRIAESAMQYQ